MTWGCAMPHDDDHNPDHQFQVIARAAVSEAVVIQGAAGAAELRVHGVTGELGASPQAAVVLRGEAELVILSVQ